MQPSSPQPAGTGRSDPRNAQHRFWRPAILVLGLAISAAIAGTVHDMLVRESSAQREITRQSLSAGLQSHIDRQLSFLRALRGLYESSEFVSESEFRRFVDVDPAMHARPWWASLGWAVRHGRLGSRTDEAVTTGLGAEDVFSLIYLASADDLDAGRTSIGTDPADRAAMTQAVETQRIAISPPRAIEGQDHGGMAIKAFMPVYQTGEKGDRRALQGFLVETIALDGFFNDFLGDAFAATSLSVRIFDGANMVFDSGGFGETSLPGEIKVADHVWRLQVDGQAMALSTGIWLPALVFSIGAALTALLYLRLLRADTEYTRIATEVNHATAELADANHRLFDRTLKLQEAADDLRRTSQEAQLANAAKTVFLANMSHELRTPLNAIIGFSEMITSRALGENSPRYYEYAGDISTSGRYLLSIIEDLLDMSRIELGKLQLKEEPVTISALVGDVMKFVSLRAREKHIELRPVDLEAMPEILVDPKAIRQALINLFTNAIKFSSDGGSVEVRGRLDSSGIALSVVDQGSGIGEEDLKHAFEPFWQGEAYRSKSRDGIGLGLAITQRLIQAHGGDVEIESRLGEGTTVSIRLPTARIVRNKPLLTIVRGGAA